MKECLECGFRSDAIEEECRACGGTQLKDDAEAAEVAKLRQEALERSESIQVFTILNPVSHTIKSELGLVFGNSSKQAFWGLSTQANRLSRAYEAALINLKYDAALMGADAVIGVQFALNNSTGSSAKLVAGSSEAVMLLGTAVKTS